MSPVTLLITAASYLFRRLSDLSDPNQKRFIVENAYFNQLNNGAITPYDCNEIKRHHPTK
jgi:hypothetical protein